MTKVMIPIEKSILDQLWSVRKSDTETWSQILSRVLTPPPVTSPPHAPPPRPSGKCSVEVLGELRSFSTAIDAFVWLLDTLSELDADLPERLARAVSTGRRNHLSRTREGVYPLRPDLAANARMLKCGWFVGSNIANRDKQRIVKSACHLLRLAYGKDVVFRV